MSDESQVLVLSSRGTAMSRLAFLPNCFFSALCLWVGQTPHDSGLLFAGTAMGFGAAVQFFASWRIKEIAIEGDRVRASSFWRTVTFPLSYVSGIEVLPHKPKRAYMYLTEPTVFGSCLTFIPRDTTPTGENPVVDQARALLPAKGLFHPAASPLRVPGAAQQQQQPAAQSGEEEPGAERRPDPGPPPSVVGEDEVGAGHRQGGEDQEEEEGADDLHGEPSLRPDRRRAALRSSARSG